MGELLIGTTLLASFLGGVVALLAPCCVSVMLPAYLATGFRHRGGVVAATLVFAAGVATLILPIGLGATALSRLLFGGHVWVFSLGGALMIVAGFAVLTGWSPNLPMPGARAARAGSYRSAYLLGMFSGAASACCAPVLAGVAVLSGAAASFPVALAVGVAYVAGMVSPLALVALIWDVRRENAARAVTDKKIVLRWGHYRRTLAVGTAISGVLMIAMGALSIALAVTGSRDAQQRLADRAVGLAATPQRLTLHAVSWLPGWALLAILAAGFAVLIGRVIRRRPSRTPADDHSDVDDMAPSRKDSDDQLWLPRAPDNQRRRGSCRYGRGCRGRIRVAAARTVDQCRHDRGDRGRRGGGAVSGVRQRPGTQHIPAAVAATPTCRGKPGAGSPAPAFTLASSQGRQVSLADYRGRSVLLYFQEGLSCQPCWDQIGDLEHHQSALRGRWHRRGRLHHHRPGAR